MSAPWRVLHVLDHSQPTYDGYVFRTLGILGVQRARVDHRTFHGPASGQLRDAAAGGR